MATTFKRPLAGPRKDTPAPVHDDAYFRAIREAYELLGGNPFGIQPTKLKPVLRCDAPGCSRTTDPNSKIISGACAGFCGYG